jgi:hypothetical protein
MEWLVTNLRPNNNVTANTLGGRYKAPLIGNSMFGDMLYDKDLPMTLFSQSVLTDMNCVRVEDNGRKCVVNFPEVDIDITFEYIDGIMAADLMPLKQAYEMKQMHSTFHHLMPTYRRNWTNPQMDQPHSLLSRYKIVKEIPNLSIRKLDNVHQALINMCAPSATELITKLQSGELIGANFDSSDVRKYFDLFDADLHALKARSEDIKLSHEKLLDRLQPGESLLSADAFFISGKAYMLGVHVTLGDTKNGYTYVKEIGTESAVSSTEAIAEMVVDLKSKGFHPKIVEYDRAKGVTVSSDYLKEVYNIEVVHVSTHACYAENRIKFLKQRIRARLSSLVFPVTGRLLTEIVIGCTHIINKVARKSNKGKSSYAIHHRRNQNYKDHYAFSPANYVEVHVESNNNVTHYRRVSAIPLYPDKSNPCDWHFYSLETAQTFVRHRSYAEKLPWTSSMINRVRYLAYMDPVLRDEEISLQGTDMGFVPDEIHIPLNRRGRRRRNLTQQPQQTDNADLNARNADAPTQTQLHSQPAPQSSSEPVAAATLIYNAITSDSYCDYSNLDPVIEHQMHSMINDLYDEIPYYDLIVPSDLNSPSELGVCRQPTDLPNLSESQLASAFNTMQSQVMINPGKLWENTVFMAISSDGSADLSSNHIQADKSKFRLIKRRDLCCDGMFSTQVAASKAIETFGERGRQALIDEIDGLLDFDVFESVLISNLTAEQRKKVIRMSCFLKEKFDSQGKLIKLKARLVAGGHLQNRSLYSTETASPTVSTSSIFSIASIGATEKRHFMIFDVYMAYLHAKMPEEVFMTLDKATTLLLIERARKKGVAHDFKIGDDGRATVKLNKALYGCIQSARLWHNVFSDFLTRQGYVPNPVDACVYNKMNSRGNQCTVCIHVDDGMATCKDIEELQLLEAALKKEYGDKTSSEIGMKVFQFLGMTIDLSNGKSALLTMPNFTDEAVNELGVKTSASTPASQDLFTLDEHSPKLSEEQHDKFHRVVAKLLYLSTRTRPDVMLPVTFLCSRVNCSTESDMKKLIRVCSYLKETRLLGIHLGAADSDISLRVYADASFAVHKDAKSHGGIVIVTSHGPTLAKAGKQKIVTRSSTEAELVTLSDAVSLAVYHLQFLKGQGYNVSADLMQDNLSTIHMARNGKSTSDRTRHVNIRYFFVKQYLDDGSMNISHCPTLDMIADILTKPIQGEHFVKLRDLLLGYQ